MQQARGIEFHAAYPAVGGEEEIDLKAGAEEVFKNEGKGVDEGGNEEKFAEGEFFGEFGQEKEGKDLEHGAEGAKKERGEEEPSGGTETAAEDAAEFGGKVAVIDEEEKSAGDRDGESGNEAIQDAGEHL